MLPLPDLVVNIHQQAGKESEFDPSLTKAAASQLIDQLRQETGRGVDSSAS